MVDSCTTYCRSFVHRVRPHYHFTTRDEMEKSLLRDDIRLLICVPRAPVCVCLYVSLCLSVCNCACVCTAIKQESALCCESKSRKGSGGNGGGDGGGGGPFLAMLYARIVFVENTQLFPFHCVISMPVSITMYPLPLHVPSERMCCRRSPALSCALHYCCALFDICRMTSFSVRNRNGEFAPFQTVFLIPRSPNSTNKQCA